MDYQKNILVTGCHRSGSTWVGKTLAYSQNVFYLGEPFNPNISYLSSCCPHKFQYWFEYVNEQNQSKYYDSIQKALDLSYDWSMFAKSVKNLKSLNNYLAFYTRISKYRSKTKKNSRRILMKDPIAVFSSKWLAETFDMQVVV